MVIQMCIMCECDGGCPYRKKCRWACIVVILMPCNIPMCYIKIFCHILQNGMRYWRLRWIRLLKLVSFEIFIIQKWEQCKQVTSSNEVFYVGPLLAFVRLACIFTAGWKSRWLQPYIAKIICLLDIFQVFMIFFPIIQQTTLIWILCHKFTGLNNSRSQK